MNAVRHVEAGGDASTTERVSSPAVTTTLTQPLCGRSFFHVAHDVAEGTCEGYLDPTQMTPEEIREAVETARREAAGYGYWSGYSDSREGRQYRNPWRAADQDGDER